MSRGRSRKVRIPIAIGTESPEDGLKAESPKRKVSPMSEAASPESEAGVSDFENKSDFEHPKPEIKNNSDSDSYRNDIPHSELIQPQSENPKLPTETMEVHHHPDVEKKGLKEYILEGLMIFLAVMMGFFAENIREGITETHVEKQYAKALYTELTDDSTVAATILHSRIEKEKDLDYLRGYFKDSSLTSLPRKFYPVYTRGFFIINRYAFEPKDGILSQLRSSGSLRYFKSVALQKLLGDLSVSINNMRYRNEQEYQFFASPLKPFLLAHFDFGWLDELRSDGTDPNVLNVLDAYLSGTQTIKGNILNVSSFNRDETCNMVSFYKQLIISTNKLQLHNYIATNRQILQVLRSTYYLKNE